MEYQNQGCGGLSLEFMLFLYRCLLKET